MTIAEVRFYDQVWIVDRMRSPRISWKVTETWQQAGWSVRSISSGVDPCSQSLILSVIITHLNEAICMNLIRFSSMSSWWQFECQLVTASLTGIRCCKCSGDANDLHSEMLRSDLTQTNTGEVNLSVHLMKWWDHVMVLQKIEIEDKTKLVGDHAQLTGKLIDYIICFQLGK